MLRVAETFTSVQGEGSFSGVLTFFIRLAGCNVGRKRSKFTEDNTSAYEMCESIDGARFICDTNFRATKEMLPVDLLTTFTDSGAPQICISGGEPMLQMSDLLPFLCALPTTVKVSMETSGTIPLAPVPAWVFITCSPKRGFLAENIQRVDEFKLLIGPYTNLDNMAAFIKRIEGQCALTPIYLMPINDINSINREPVANCMKLLRDFPNCRLGVQMHKVYGMR